MNKVDTILFFINDSKNKHGLIFKTLQKILSNCSIRRIR